MIITLPPSITVFICDQGDQRCRFADCRKSADLVVVQHCDDANSPDKDEDFCCVEHWGTLRPQFIRHGHDIHYGEGVPELIVARLSEPMNGRGGGTS